MGGQVGGCEVDGWDVGSREGVSMDFLLHSSAGEDPSRLHAPFTGIDPGPNPFHSLTILV